MRVGRWLVPCMVVALLATACSRSSSNSKSNNSGTTAPSSDSGDFGSLKNVCGSGDGKGATALGVTDSTIRVGTMSDPGNTASAVWADTGYRSKKNEDLLRQRMLKSRIHRKKPARRPMPDRTARANARKLRIPTKPAMHSKLKPATCSDVKPAGVPI